MIRLSEFLLAFGFSFENVVLPIIFIVTPFLTFTIPISFMFALMLSFLRLSSDGEYTAMLASGMGLKRVLVPVSAITFVLLLASIYSGTFLESWGRREYLAFTFKKTQNELDNLIRSKMQPGVFVEDFLGYTFYSEKVDANKENYENVFISPKNEHATKGIAAVTAPRAVIKGSVEEESLKMTLFNGKSYSVEDDSKVTNISTFERLDIDILRLFRQQIFGSETRGNDYRSYSTLQLYNYLKGMEEVGDVNTKKYYKPRFLFHSRISSGFATLIFAIFGIVLGIADARRGKAAAYTYAVATVIASYVFITSFKGVAEAGEVAAPFAVWFPLGIQFVFGMFLLYQKNRLPPSEAVLSPRNIPIIEKLFK
jgi:lipopolysaccharide export system permease protein